MIAFFFCIYCRNVMLQQLWPQLLSNNNEDKRNKEAGNITPNLALNDILNGLGGFGYNDNLNGLGFGYNDNLKDLNGLKDALPATAKMVNQKTLRLHKIFDLYKNLTFWQISRWFFIGESF